MDRYTSPMKDLDFRGRRVLVTGASSGLGAEMAEQLARDHGAHLVLIARREERLRQLADRLQHRYGCEAEIIAADLVKPAEVERVFRRATKDAPLYAAILNAGVTHFGHHDELSWEAFEQMLDLNVKSTARLTSLLVPYFEQRGEQGGVMLVASMAGMVPVSYQAAYSGTKAFLVNYACSLHHEMLHRGVSVTVFTPGGIVTEMTEGERFNDLRAWLQPVGRCAREGLLGFKRRDYVTIPSLLYRWGFAVVRRVVPERFLVGRTAAVYRNSLVKNSR
jgi:short-subunit dehydrogenase